MATVERSHTPIEEWAELVVNEQDADKKDEKEYHGYIRYLLNDRSKYDYMSMLYPGNTFSGVRIQAIWPTTTTTTTSTPATTEQTKHDAELMKKSTLFTDTASGLGCNIHIESTDLIRSTYPTISFNPMEDLILNITGISRDRRDVGIFLSFRSHANLLFIDSSSQMITRYDPHVPSNCRGYEKLDAGLSAMFAMLLPEYVYVGNTLAETHCVQFMRGVGRIHKSDYFCQDYCLLYLERRITLGMNHEEAAFDLVAQGNEILDELKQLLIRMAIVARTTH